jgi:acyl-CoA thioesterase-1
MFVQKFEDNTHDKCLKLIWGTTSNMVKIHKRANLWQFVLLFIFITGCSNDEEIPASSAIPYAEEKAEQAPFRILILGDSLTEGYGVSPAQAYPSLLEAKLNKNLLPEQRPYQVINGGVTGSTTSGGASRIDWHLKSPPDYLIVALGGNDGLRGIPPRESKQNLKSIIERALQKKVAVMIAGMKLPPNYGPVHLRDFEKIFPELSNELKVPLLPFLLEGVGGKPGMNLPDRIHPNPAGQRLICETVYKHLIEHLPNN